MNYIEGLSQFFSLFYTCLFLILGTTKMNI